MQFSSCMRNFPIPRQCWQRASHALHSSAACTHKYVEHIQTQECHTYALIGCNIYLTMVRLIHSRFGDLRSAIFQTFKKVSIFRMVVNDYSTQMIHTEYLLSPKQESLNSHEIISWPCTLHWLQVAFHWNIFKNGKKWLAATITMTGNDNLFARFTDNYSIFPSLNISLRANAVVALLWFLFLKTHAESQQTTHRSGQDITNQVVPMCKGH